MTDPYSSQSAIVLYGGTFDPIHRAHVAVARALARKLGIPVTLLPNYRSPLKSSPQEGDQRLTLIQLAIRDCSELNVNTLELERQQPSYTIDSLLHFRERYPAKPLIWLMGADSYHSLERWHRWQELPALCHLVIAPRPGVSTSSPCVADTLFQPTEASQLLQTAAGLRYHMSRPMLDVSATAIRDALKNKGTCPALDESVLTYIQQHGLYGCRSTH